MRTLTLAAAAASLLLTSAASAQGLKDWEEDISSPGRAASVYVWVEGESEAAAWGPFGTKNRSAKPSDPFLLASVSKIYTAVAVVKLAEQARIDLDGPIADYLPDPVVSRMPGLDRITVRQALAMRSGLVEYYTDDNLLAATGGSPEAMLEYVYGERLEFAPNTDYEYSNTNYLLAEILLREVTGKRFGPALDELVFAPGRLQNSEALGYGIGPRDMVMGYSAGALDSLSEFLNYYSGFGFGDGGVVATAEDVAKFYRALLIDRTLLGDWGLRQIISDPEGDQYGLGIEVENDADLGLVYGHSGSDTGYLTDVRLTPDPPAVAVILTAEEDSNTGLTYEMLWEFSE
ncbi:MAG: serine hydrolase domain-containing protein [Alphaproteobacteria bacterium]